MDWIARLRETDAVEGPPTSDLAIRALVAGNARFIEEMAPEVPAPIPKQAPFAVVLGCSDARVPSEIIFDVRANQFFVVRVAGNVLADECLGSIEYALHNFKDTVHLLMVLGHTGCGAVGAAVDAYLSPTQHNSIAFTRSLRAVVNHVLIAVRGGAVSLEEVWGQEVKNDPGYRAALAEVAVYLNAGMTAYHLQEEMHAADRDGVRVVYGVYDVATCRVIGPDLATDDTCRLAPAPTRPDDLLRLGEMMAASPTVAQHLSESLRQKRQSKSSGANPVSAGPPAG
jgi:carbonic anhydrase